MGEYFPEPKSLGEKEKIEVDLSNYATKADVDKLVPVLTGLSKLCDITTNGVAKKMYKMLR